MSQEIENRRFDYQKVHGEIENYIIQHLQKSKRFPTDQEIADGVGIDRKTVLRHKADINFNKFLPDLKALTPKIFQSFAFKLMAEPDGKNIATWMKYVEGYDQDKDKK